ncbi:hypothetical protein B0A55_06760 [Friedmanniomyces simplex]|uniref:Uncharacterized protein n=1 Tax=Friedmanniomyces simplex TaxID=329884 RepID=A0A4U0XAB2_9PEZI|nr:hypothetical protein B0A55_06760 [Friedmanniomyces simplex]
MESKPEEVEKLAPQLIQQAKSEGSSFAGSGVQAISGKELADLMIRLNSQFPNDIGLFVTFFLNYVKLDVGEAMFLKADDIHAYLSGDIIECMASSDNVVRAGFTPKFKDFSVVRTALNSSGSKITFEAIDGPSIVICTQGEGKISIGPKTEEIKEGYVYFVGATAELVIESTGQGEMVTFKAFCELSGKEGSGEKTNGKM